MYFKNSQKIDRAIESLGDLISMAAVTLDVSWWWCVCQHWYQLTGTLSRWSGAMEEAGGESEGAWGVVGGRVIRCIVQRTVWHYNQLNTHSWRLEKGMCVHMWLHVTQANNCKGCPGQKYRNNTSNSGVASMTPLSYRITFLSPTANEPIHKYYYTGLFITTDLKMGEREATL